MCHIVINRHKTRAWLCPLKCPWGNVWGNSVCSTLPHSRHLFVPFKRFISLTQITGSHHRKSQCVWNTAGFSCFSHQWANRGTTCKEGQQGCCFYLRFHFTTSQRSINIILFTDFMLYSARVYTWCLYCLLCFLLPMFCIAHRSTNKCANVTVYLLYIG